MAANIRVYPKAERDALLYEAARRLDSTRRVPMAGLSADTEITP